MQAQPQKEHEWLKKLLGQWTIETDAPSSPGAPPDKLKGSERVRSIGDLWIVCDGQGEMPGGGKATMQMTIGYDPQRQRFVGTWIGSMMTHLWVYEGELDAAGKVLTLNSEGPDFTAPGKTARYRDVIELLADDHRTLTSYAQGPDGQWQKFMTAHFRRSQ